MSPTATDPGSPERKERVNFAALLPAILFMGALIPFATVRPGHRLALAALALMVGGALALLGPRDRQAPWARAAFGLGVLSWLWSALGAIPLGAEGRALLQPAVAPAVTRALAVVGADSHPLALDPWRALLEWSLAAGLLLLAAGTAAATDRVATARRVAALLVGAGVVVVFTAWAHRSQAAPGIWWIEGMPAFTRDPFFAPFVSPNHAGATLAALTGLAAALAWTGPPRARIAAGLGALALVGGVLTSGSRAALLDMGLALFVTALLAGGRRARLALGGVGVAALVGLLAVGPGRLALWVTERVTPELYESIEAGYSDVLSGRGDLYEAVIGLLGGARWLGVGGGGFDDAYRIVKATPDFSIAAHAHQEPLQIAVEHGLPGLLLALLGAGLLLVGGALAAWGAEPGPRRALLAGGVGALAALALDSQVDFPFRIGAIATLGAVLAGLLAGLARAPDDSGASQPDQERPTDPLPRPGRWPGRVAPGALGLVGLAAAAWASWLDRAEPARATWAPSEAAERQGDEAVKLAIDEADRAAQGELLDLAADAYAEAVRRQPTRREALQKLGRLRQARGDLDGAEAAFEAATAVYPTLPWSWRDLARLRAARGDVAGASEAWRAMLALNLPELATPYVREALAGAVDPLARAQIALPPRADRWVAAAKLADEGGDRLTAERFYRRAADLAPAAAIELVSALLRWNRPGEAALLLPGLPDSCRKNVLEAEIMLGEAKLVAAEASFEAAVYRCGSKDRRARLGLGRARAALGDPSGLRTLEALVEEDPTDPMALRAIIRELESLGRFLEARKYRDLLENPPEKEVPEEVPVPEQ